MRHEREVLRRQAGIATMQACFVPGQPLVLAAAGSDGAVHLLDLSNPGGMAPPLTGFTEPDRVLNSIQETGL